MVIINYVTQLYSILKEHFLLNNLSWKRIENSPRVFCLIKKLMNFSAHFSDGSSWRIIKLT